MHAGPDSGKSGLLQFKTRKNWSNLTYRRTTRLFAFPGAVTSNDEPWGGFTVRRSDPFSCWKFQRSAFAKNVPDNGICVLISDNYRRPSVLPDSTERIATHPRIIHHDSWFRLKIPKAPSLFHIYNSLSLDPTKLPNFSSYRINNNLSTHPPLGNSFSHWLCKCTENTFLSALSNPPPSSLPSPIVHAPPCLSATNGSGRRLSSLHDRASLKQNGRTLNGGIEDATSRRQSLK